MRRSPSERVEVERHLHVVEGHRRAVGVGVPVRLAVEEAPVALGELVVVAEQRSRDARHPGVVEQGLEARVLRDHREDDATPIVVVELDAGSSGSPRRGRPPRTPARARRCRPRTGRAGAGSRRSGRTRPVPDSARVPSPAAGYAVTLREARRRTYLRGPRGGPGATLGGQVCSAADLARPKGEPGHRRRCAAASSTSRSRTAATPSAASARVTARPTRPDRAGDLHPGAGPGRRVPPALAGAARQGHRHQPVRWASRCCTPGGRLRGPGQGRGVQGHVSTTARCSTSVAATTCSRPASTRSTSTSARRATTTRRCTAPVRAPLANVVRFNEDAGRGRVTVIVVNHRQDHEHVAHMDRYWTDHGIRHVGSYEIMNRGGSLFVDHMQYEPTTSCSGRRRSSPSEPARALWRTVLLHVHRVRRAVLPVLLRLGEAGPHGRRVRPLAARCREGQARPLASASRVRPATSIRSTGSPRPSRRAAGAARARPTLLETLVADNRAVEQVVERLGHRPRADRDVRRLIPSAAPVRTATRTSRHHPRSSRRRPSPVPGRRPADVRRLRPARGRHRRAPPGRAPRLARPRGRARRRRTRAVGDRGRHRGARHRRLALDRARGPGAGPGRRRRLAGARRGVARRPRPARAPRPTRRRPALPRWAPVCRSAGSRSWSVRGWPAPSRPCSTA